METDKLKKLMDEAEEEAKRNSVDGIVGRVTRFENVRVGESHYVLVDVAFEDYLRTQVRRGEYLAIRSIIPRVTMVGVVEAITRSDMLASLKIREVNNYSDPSTLMTPTTIQLTPITEMDDKGRVRPAVSPIDPQSPVFRPRPELLEKALGIPEKGIVVGKVYSGGEVIEANVRLDEFTLTHHVLLIGTTGSGKTTFLKRVVSQDSMEKQSVVFDRQGDFVRLALEKLRDATIVMPVTTLMEGSTTEDYVNLFLDRYGNAKDVVIGHEYVSLEYENSRLYLVPYSIAFSEVMMNFHKMTPYMSPAASLVWESLMRKTKELLIYNLMDYFGKDTLPYTRALEFYETEVKPRLSIDNLTERPVSFQPRKLQVVKGKSKEYVKPDNEGNLKLDVSKAFEKAMESLSLAPQTKESISRLLKSYKEFGIFDVPGTFNHIGKGVWKEKNIIVDLSWVLDYTASVEALATISYKLLSDFFKYKDEMYKQGQQSTLSLLIMDEAHEYFPQASNENAKGVIEDLINKLMRLGRVRRLGVILATHYPDDLNELVIQLSNTKVIMRNDPQVLKKLSAEDYSDILTNAEPGVGLIRSMRFTNVLFKSLVP
ncbi:MAG: hypothetical protein ASUL_02769 [Candidatus Aramenus sulfurataquae]|uniref:ATP-binding protein n=5 Tax=Candidatus Aramenus sulfurataquae TaxID=1326980 RepID=A0ACC6TQI4_9CREN|nr:MAG: hypothetical protein ASUL_02769 [Candidatus Aramenus sulfurataquae]